jgi:rod shape-determining protein MreC
MLASSDRGYSRRDTWLFLACVVLSLTVMFLPSRWSVAVTASLRRSVLAPFVWLEQRAEEGRTSRMRLNAVTAQRDSTALIAQALPALAAENEHLRRLLGLTRRLTGRYVPAEVLHQAQATDERMLLLSAGSDDGVAPFDPVIAPEGLVGVIFSVGRATSAAMTWAHPEFRVSAFTADGRVSGMVGPSPNGATSDAALEFRAITYRDTVALGTMVLSSGLGGVYPKGIPLGRVVGVEREQSGWERVYRLHAAANPGIVSHVLVLVGERTTPLSAAFPGDSILAALRADSLHRVFVRESTERARSDTVAVLRRRVDSLAAVTGRPMPRAAAGADSVPKAARPAPARRDTLARGDSAAHRAAAAQHPAAPARDSTVRLRAAPARKDSAGRPAAQRDTAR